jgi:aminoglycoside phosphotransferase (APT) family kinase protein
MAELPPWSARLAAHLAEQTGCEVSIVGIQPLAGGACQDNFRVDVTVGGRRERYALRSDARASLTGSLSREVERQVIDLAVQHGVPTPAVRGFVRDLLRPGSNAYLMDWVEGVAIGAKVLRDPALEGARAVLPGQLAQALATLHRIERPRGTALLAGEATSAQDDVSATAAVLAFQRLALDRLAQSSSAGPRPALELVYRWLAGHAPPERETVLVHGDFRTGNFLVGPHGLGAVVDWEFAHWGSPVDDLGWFCVRDWRFGQLDREAGGLIGREAFFELYLAAGGRSVTPAEWRWWEIAGNLRWATGAHEQAQRVLCGAETDLELLAIGRRACEMEYEALRLMEVA